MTTNETVIFECAISDTATALKTSGKLEGGSRVSFDVPATELLAFLALHGLVNHRLRVTVQDLGGFE